MCHKFGIEGVFLLFHFILLWLTGDQTNIETKSRKMENWQKNHEQLNKYSIKKPRNRAKILDERKTEHIFPRIVQTYQKGRVFVKKEVQSSRREVKGGKDKYGDMGNA